MQAMVVTYRLSAQLHDFTGHFCVRAGSGGINSVPVFTYLSHLFFAAQIQLSSPDPFATHEKDRLLCKGFMDRQSVQRKDLFPPSVPGSVQEGKMWKQMSDRGIEAARKAETICLLLVNHVKAKDIQLAAN